MKNEKLEVQRYEPYFLDGVGRELIVCWAAQRAAVHSSVKHCRGCYTRYNL